MWFARKGFDKERANIFADHRNEHHDQRCHGIAVEVPRRSRVGGESGKGKRHWDNQFVVRISVLALLVNRVKDSEAREISVASIAFDTPITCVHPPKRSNQDVEAGTACQGNRKHTWVWSQNLPRK